MARSAWTVVQHSGFGYNGDPCFSAGLETRRCLPCDQVIVTKVGGLLFDSPGAAEDFTEKAMYPPGAEGLIPAAAGTFSDKTVDQLRIYIPVRAVVG